MEKKEVFSQFNEKVSEITQHYEEIEEMKFDAKLKNGTHFSFDFNSDKFNRKTGTEKREHHPVSVFNAVVDILSACTALALMILWFVIFFPIFFITSSVYHFLDEELTRAVKVMFIVRMGLLIASSALLCTTFCLYRGFLYTIIYLVLAALSLRHKKRFQGLQPDSGSIIPEHTFLQQGLRRTCNCHHGSLRFPTAGIRPGIRQQKTAECKDNRNILSCNAHLVFPVSEHLLVGFCLNGTPVHPQRSEDFIKPVIVVPVVLKARFIGDYFHFKKPSQVFHIQ